MCKTVFIEVGVNYIPETPSPQETVLVQKPIQNVWETHLREKKVI